MINPILASSARRRMRSIKTPLIITLYGALLFFFALFSSVLPLFSQTITIGQMRRGVESYIYLMIIQFVMLVLVAPAMTAGAISGERERQTLDLLLVTNTGALRLVLGRLLESFLFLALLIFSSFPTMCLILAAGGITLAQMLEGLLFLFATAYAALCVGIFCSSLLRRTVTATVVSYLTVFAIGILTLIPLISDVNRIGKLLDAAASSGVTLTTIDILPYSFIVNPALSLFSLIADQTGLLRSTVGQFSYTLTSAFDKMQFGVYARCGMAFLAAAGSILLLLSALFVRPSAIGRRRHGA